MVGSLTENSTETAREGRGQGQRQDPRFSQTLRLELHRAAGNRGWHVKRRASITHHVPPKSASCTARQTAAA